MHVMPMRKTITGLATINCKHKRFASVRPNENLIDVVQGFVYPTIGRQHLLTPLHDIQRLRGEK